MDMQAPHLRIHTTCDPTGWGVLASRCLFLLLLLLPFLALLSRHTLAQDAPPPAHIALSEVQPNPRAVPDSGGEWIELFNTGAEGVNLAGWQVRIRSGYSATLVNDLWIDPGGYAVLTEVRSPLQNGGVVANGLLPGLVLDDADALELYSADGQLMESAAWGNAPDSPQVLPGRSLERITFDTAPRWAVAWQPWPGSAGDWGSPGAAWTPPPAPPTSIPPTFTPAPPLPAAWPRPASGAPPSALQMDEVFYRGSEGEYIVLVNTSGDSVVLSGWQLGDASRPGDAEAIAFLPADAQIPPGGAYIVARSGAGFAARWLVAPDAQFEADNSGSAGTPILARNAWLAGGAFALDDGGDELVLLNPAGVLADALCYGDGDCAALGLAGRLDAPDGHALQRVPGPDFVSAPNVPDRWALLPAAPLEALQWPAPAPHAPVTLPGDLHAYWGVLDAPSTWSGAALPPRALLAAAAALGLDFIALADPKPHAPIANAPVTLLPAWGWQGDGDSAVIFAGTRPDANAWPAGLDDRYALLPWARNQGAPLLWRKGDAPTLAEIPSLAARPADALASSAAAAALLESWRAAGGPLLPAGSGLTAPFAVALPAPRYTGLAAPSAAPDALTAALAARRGWLSSDAGLWLALTAGNDRVWMGGIVAPANALPFTVRAGDSRGGALHVTLWQNGVPVAEADTQSGGAWSQTLLAPPDAWFHATATRADGAFAISAPIHVAQPLADSMRMAIQMIEALPRPTRDWNGDGNIDSGDEYVRLINRGAQPVALAGWQLFDSNTAAEGSARFTFTAAHVLPAQAELLLWRSETHLVLNDARDHLYLFLPGGGLADEVFWEEAEPDTRFVRVGDGTRLEPVPQDAADAPVVQVAALQGAVENAPAGANAMMVGASPASAIDAVPAAAAPGLPGVADVATARALGIRVEATVRGVVILPPGLLHSTLYIAETSGAPEDAGDCGAGLRVFLPIGDFPALAPGDVVVAHGELTTFRGERELRIDTPAAIAATGAGALPQPLATHVTAIGEAFEGRLVIFTGVVAWADGDSLYLHDPAQPQAPAVRVMVARSLGWPRPAALPGQRWRVTGVVSQMARAAPWNGGYRVLVRWPSDLELIAND